MKALLDTLASAKRPEKAGKEHPVPKSGEKPAAKKPAVKKTGPVTDVSEGKSAARKTRGKKAEPVKKVPEEKPAAVKGESESAAEQVPATVITRKETAPVTEQPISRAGFAPYAQCVECSLGSYHQFASVPQTVLATAIVQIVSVEGPISPDMLIKRVKELGNSARMTPAVKQTIRDIVTAEVRDGRLIPDSEGFLMVPEGVIVPRPRPSRWSIEDVSIPEIAAASAAVLAKQFSTPKPDLIRQTGIVLGFKAMESVKERVSVAVERAIADGLILCENGVCRVK
jgi:hypothetical protein